MRSSSASSSVVGIGLLGLVRFGSAHSVVGASFAPPFALPRPPAAGGGPRPPHTRTRRRARGNARGATDGVGLDGIPARSDRCDGSVVPGGAEDEGGSGSGGADEGDVVDPLAMLPQLHGYRRPRQRRRTSAARPRKPRRYWKDPAHLRDELARFWTDLDAPSLEHPPPVPSERLLHRFGRHDLRWAIAQAGGREAVSHWLGGAAIVSGRWEEARETEAVKRLLSHVEEDGTEERRRKDRRRDAQRSGKEARRPLEDPMLDDRSAGRTNGHDGDATTHMSLASLVASSEAPANSSDAQAKKFWSKEKVVKEL
ncbi:hypothetical protein ACHAWF_007294 [Thalassiosira exigua]